MKGIYSTSIHEGILDECPMTYKSLDDIIEKLKTVEEEENIIILYTVESGSRAW